MTLRLVLFVSLLVAGGVRAQATSDAGPLSPAARASLGISTDEGARLYAEGRAAALAFRLDAARGRFQALAEAEPGSLAGAFGLETTALWRALMTEDDDHYDRFYALNDSLTAAAEARGAEAEETAAVVKLHRALGMARQERYARAGASFRDACGRFRTLADRPGAGPDVQFGQGVCEVAAGAVPRKYRWLARILGFWGSVAGGLARLTAAAEGDGAQVVEATVALAIADATLNERRAGGVDRLADLADAHAQSPALAYLAGYHLLLDRRADEAEAAFRRAQHALAGDDVQPIPFVDAHLGIALFQQDRFEAALPLLETYARTFRGRALKATATLYAGLAHEMLGDRRRAESTYRRVRAARDYDSDLTAAREAERRLKAPMTASERRLLLGQNAFDSGRYADAIAVLQPVLTDRSLPEVDRAEAAYRTGRAYQALDDGPEAIRHFRLAIDRPGDPLAKWGPWSLYHTAEVLEQAGEVAEARGAYQSVLENEAEFDFHKALEQRTRTALERLDR